MVRRRIPAIIAVAVAAYFAFWPVPIVPVAWHPPPNPGRTGPFAGNDRLRGVQQLPVPGPGPEDVTLGPGGWLYTGLEDGRIVRLPPQGGPAETFVSTGGRPLGMQFDRGGNLIVADAFRGLIAVSPGRDIRVLADHAGFEKIRFANDLDIAADGAIWFTDSSRRFDQRHWMLDFWEAMATGRLIRYDPATGRADVRLDGLQFANGVALAPGGEFALVSETVSARVTRFWLTGPHAGLTEPFALLPGYPDNISYNGNGVFWVALASPRVDALEALAQLPRLRTVVYRLPVPLRDPKPERSGWVIGLDRDGKVVHNLQDQGRAYGPITSVNEFAGQLYFGSIGMAAVGRIPAPAR